MAKSLRDVYGEALVKFGKNDDRIVVLDADVSSSTKSALFAKAYPDRFFNVGIAESNMVAIAGGLASEGKIPFVNTFAVFLSTIGAQPARVCAYSGLGIKMMGAYGGMSDAYDGATHHAVEDVAIMRAIPTFVVYVASDEVQTEWLIQHALDTKEPAYIRLSRDVMPTLYQPGESFEAGKGKVIRDGKDATIIACGLMCGKALEAAEALAKEGIDCRVVDMFTVKPIDEELVARCAAETKAIVTAEEHSVIGGLGGAVAEALALCGAGVPMRMVGIEDSFTMTGAYNDILKHFGLTSEAIAEKVKEALKA